MLTENLHRVKSSLPNNVLLVAVSKTKPIEDLQEIYTAGHRHFGENKVQEMVDKYETLPKDISWHLIGHLQTNKVKYIASFVHLIHAVDSLKLLIEINKQAQKHNRIINCLLQFHIAKEDTKFGMNWDEFISIIESEEFKKLQNIQICGLMGMATFTDNKEQIRNEFKELNQLFQKIKQTYYSDSESFQILSMGMSGDYSIAIEEGSTLVRVGSSIFGHR